jgi:hypothetical protein
MRKALTAVALIVFVGCSTPSTDDVAPVLNSTAGNLSAVESGELTLRLETAAKDGDVGGFEVAGPFSFDSDGELPLFDVDYTYFDGDTEEESRLVSDGDAAYVVADGKTRRLSPAQVQDSGLLTLGDTERSPLRDVDLSQWVRGESEIEGGGTVGGVDTDKVTADLEVAEVLNGLGSLSQTLGRGAGLQPVTDSEAQRLRRAVKTAAVEIWTGKQDRILRRLLAEIEFELRSEELRDELEELAGAKITLDATLDAVNEPVEVETPT